MPNYVNFNNKIFEEYVMRTVISKKKSKNKIYDEISKLKSVSLQSDSIRKYYKTNIKPSTQEMANAINDYFIKELKLPKGDKSLIMSIENKKEGLRGANNMNYDFERIDKAIVREIMDKWYTLYASISPGISPLAFEYYDEVISDDPVYERDIDYDILYSHIHYDQGHPVTLIKYHELVTTLCKAEQLIPYDAYSKINMLIKKVAFIFVLDNTHTHSWNYIMDEECLKKDEYLNSLKEEKRLCCPCSDEHELMTNIIICIEEDLKKIFIELLK